MRKNTFHTIKLALLMSLIAFIGGTSTLHADIIDPASEDYQVTTEMLDSEHGDYDEGAVDLVGKSIYKYMQFGGDASALSAEQKSAAEGYYDRYEDAPFFGLSTLWILLCAFLVFIMHLGFS
ncbi:MAG: hypothetical protein N2F24_00660, partial [Deltaproteobacteria bacterium]